MEWHIHHHQLLMWEILSSFQTRRRSGSFKFLVLYCTSTQSLQAIMRLQTHTHLTTRTGYPFLQLTRRASFNFSNFCSEDCSEFVRLLPDSSLPPLQRRLAGQVKESTLKTLLLSTGYLTRLHVAVSKYLTRTITVKVARNVKYSKFAIHWINA